MPTKSDNSILATNEKCIDPCQCLCTSSEFFLPRDCRFPETPFFSNLLEASVGEEEAYTSLTLQSGYSPSGNFIHVEQTTEGDIGAGDIIGFRVNSTREARNFYYEVLSRGTVIFTHVSSGPDIEFVATQLMAPSSRILVYQILPNNEIAADYLPFSVQASYPHQVQVGFSEEEVRPGTTVDINVQTQGESRVGLVAVDRSVDLTPKK